MAQAPISPGPRKEAGALAPTRLTAPQLAALDRLRDLVAGLQRSAMEEADPNDEPYLARIEADRRSNTILIDGPRGTGKTSLLLTAIAGWLGSWTRPTHGRPRVRAGDPPKPAVLPLPILDLSTLEPGVTLDLMLAARLRALVTALDSGEGAGNKDPAASLEDRWDTFVELAAGQGAGRLGQSSATALERAEDLRQLATNGVHRAERLGELMRALRAAALRQWGVDLMIVVTVDDADVQPTRADELLRTLRVLHHPRLAFLVAGDIELLHHAVCNKLRADLPKVDDAFYLSRLSAQVLERIFPVDQRLAVRHLSPAERLKLIDGARADDTTKGPSLADLLKLVPRNFMDPWDTLFADPNLELWKGLPDRVRTLVDLQLALQRQVMEDPKEPGKQIIPPWAALRCLWEASIDLRESDPSARDTLRRSLDLYWEQVGVVPKLRLWDFTITWEHRELTRFPVDEPRDALMARSIVIRVPDRPVLRFKNGQRAHAISESLAWLMVFTADVAVDCGWVSHQEVEHFWPKEAWVSCHVRRDDGPDDVFDWPALSLKTFCHHIGWFRSQLCWALDQEVLATKFLDSLVHSYADLLVQPDQETGSEPRTPWQFFGGNPPSAHIHNPKAEWFTRQTLLGFGPTHSPIQTEGESSLSWNSTSGQLALSLTRYARAATPELIATAIRLWMPASRPTPQPKTDRRLEIGHWIATRWTEEPDLFDLSSVAQTFQANPFLRHIVQHSGEALWQEMAIQHTSHNSDKLDIVDLLPTLSNQLSEPERHCPIELVIKHSTGPTPRRPNIKFLSKDGKPIRADHVLVAILHESMGKSHPSYPLPWVPTIDLVMDYDECLWPTPGSTTIMWSLFLASKLPSFSSGSSPGRPSTLNTIPLFGALDWVRGIIQLFTCGPTRTDAAGIAIESGAELLHRESINKQIPTPWFELCPFIKTVVGSDSLPLAHPKLQASWQHFVNTMYLLTRPEAGLPDEDRATIRKYFSPPPKRKTSPRKPAPPKADASK